MNDWTRGIRLAHLLDSHVLRDFGSDVARFRDRIRFAEPEYTDLPNGSLVLTLEPMNTRNLNRRWVLRRVFRVVGFREEMDGGPEYELSLECVVSPPGSETGHEMSADELMLEHNWFPGPREFFKPLPTVVWNWLREVKGVPLPPASRPDRGA